MSNLNRKPRIRIDSVKTTVSEKNNKDEELNQVHDDVRKLHELKTQLSALNASIKEVEKVLKENIVKLPDMRVVVEHKVNGEHVKILAEYTTVNGVKIDQEKVFKEMGTDAFCRLAVVTQKSIKDAYGQNMVDACSKPYATKRFTVKLIK